MARRNFQQMSLVDQFNNIRPKRSEHLDALSKCIDWGAVQKLLDAIYASAEGAGGLRAKCARILPKRRIDELNGMKMAPIASRIGLSASA
jgi:hypothetical protein